MDNIITHQPWCTDHEPADGSGFPGQCCTAAIDVAPHVAVWLTHTDMGTRVVVDGSPLSGIELNLDEVLDLSDAVRRLYDVAVPR